MTDVAVPQAVAAWESARRRKAVGRIVVDVRPVDRR